MQQLRSSTSPNSHTPCRYPYINAVRSLSRASSETTRSLGSCNSLNKSYYPAQATIVLDVDSHAVGLLTSESRSFTRGGACPL
eukprot:scaffold23268_cov67-Phaeocystis_antarctica.AAC.7